MIAGLFLIVAAAAAPASPSPAAIDASVRTQGAKRTVDELWRSHRWDAVTDAMARGSDAWIALAPRLAQGSDAATSEELGIALAFALPRNPRAVLAALDPADGVVLGATRVCGRPFIEDSEPHGYVSSARAALLRVGDRSLAAARAACLAALDRAAR